MEYHSKDGILFMVQIDHLTGEQIGCAVGRFYDAGASNVQVVSSLTKKNRPSFIIFIDCRQQYAEAVEALIPDELGAGGWHRMMTEHHYLYNSIIERRIRVMRTADAETECGAGYKDEESCFEYTVKGKAFENGYIRPEHESVVQLQEDIQKDLGVFVRYSYAYNTIMKSLGSAADESTVLYLENSRSFSSACG